MKKFNKTCYAKDTKEFMFNVQCDGQKYHLNISEGLFEDVVIYHKLTKKELIILINFLIEIKTYIEE